MTLPEKITIEIFLLLTEFCIQNIIEFLESYALFKINKDEIYENFKKFVLTFAINSLSV